MEISSKLHVPAALTSRKISPHLLDGNIRMFRLSGICREEKIYLLLKLIETRFYISCAHTILTEQSCLLAVGGDLIIQIFVRKNLPYLVND
jgi:hypothetical protein